ncbi:hypothetical protein ONA91_08400 [Micromonospora sp. DR5-3]|uniref:hypothetical protein n=1 Tax=unclassified Micromonospora TaxID=2617518 RepID=UPI0011DB2203|nr:MULTISPECIES: hypothetical protein [unclassified Micromonospora]MCW3814476.1 hypothetical protein [Micromonospora sp. DR5-3]TYC22694.1 hypothetical protein FXF52_19480 [Micromonospora sp. MP36]
MTAIEVDPDGLSGSGRALEGAAVRFGQALAAFQAELAAFGRPWGSDDIGSLIGAAHDEVSAFAFECFDSALQEIAAAGTDLTGMATRYAEIEAAIKQGFDGLHQALGG